MGQLSSPMPRVRSPTHAPDFRRRLLRWFRRHGRDLPWRRSRDPYHVIVSEFMLQQTQVSRVEAYYHRFLARYPSVDALAAAPAAMVRESWDGLGYYRRAANLHRLAQEVVRDRAGMIPDDPVELQRLPGVGRYTAGAVASFAFERSVPAGGYQRGESPPKSVPPSSPTQGARESALEHRRAAGAPPGQERVGVQPGDHGAGSVDLHGAGGAMRGMSGAGGVRHGKEKKSGER